MMQNWLGRKQPYHVNLPRKITRLPDIRQKQPPMEVPTVQTYPEMSSSRISITLSSLVPKPSERCCFFGKTGAGKTTLAKKFLILSSMRFVIVDCKHTVRIDNVPIDNVYRKHLDYQIVRPDPANEVNDSEAIIRQAWNEGDIIIYIDELSLVNPTMAKLNRELARAIRTGRERNVSVWMASQRPKSLPSSVFTESESFYIFRLLYEGDRDKVASFTTDRMADIQERIRGYDFAYFNVVSEKLLTVHQTNTPGGYS